jgi:hypothetical protein
MLTVNSTGPASGVAITVSPADNNSAANGSTSFTRTYNAGTSIILTAPAMSGSNTFSSWTGCTTTTTVTCNVTLGTNTTVTANYTVPVISTYVLTVNSTNPASGVAITVSPADNNSAANGSTSFTRTYNSGAAVILTAPASSGGNLFSSWTGCTTTTTVTCNVTMSANKTVTAGFAITPTATVTVNQSSTGPAVNPKILGMNLAAWYDVVGNATAVNAAFAQAGIQSIRWPGGSWSDEYHWQTPNSSSNPSLPYMCHNNSSGVPDGTTSWGGYNTFAQFVTGIVQGGSYDLALTADYGTNPACTGPGQPSEAVAWVTAALADGITVSHMTVGNEEYGSWETDLHTLPNNAATYAAAVAGSSGYYALIKAASPNTQVGVVVNPGNNPAWDPTVLANASYDFVEYHYYPQGPGSENDTTLIQTDAQALTTNINTIKAELATAGHSGTPIYVGEMGSVYTLPGRQSSSITQALFAGQVLGEMMNAGVSRATWWIGFGGCDDTTSYQTLGNGTLQYANFDTAGLSYQTDVYGWQDFGGYMVFADGPSESSCEGATLPTGTLLPTARAFQLFSNVAVSGANVLTASVTGDTTDVVAYAATHSGGTALVLFNRNETSSEPVSIKLSVETSSTDVKVITYDKAIYDLSGSPTGTPADPAGTNTWAAPTTTDMGAQSFPLTLTLAPWSMNVVIIN